MSKITFDPRVNFKIALINRFLEISFFRKVVYSSSCFWKYDFHSFFSTEIDLCKNTCFLMKKILKISILHVLTHFILVCYENSDEQIVLLKWIISSIFKKMFLLRSAWKCFKMPRKISFLWKSISCTRASDNQNFLKLLLLMQTILRLFFL